MRQRRNHLMAIWLGLFAMLMIHVGPLISGTQALSSLDSDTDFTEQHLYERATPAIALSTLASEAVFAEHHQHAIMLADDVVQASAHADHAVDYHALMGHQKAPEGAPQWLANLEMCGYCDLLTISPPLVLALLQALTVPPAVQWLAVLPTPLRLQLAAHSLRHPRAPPVQLFA